MIRRIFACFTVLMLSALCLCGCGEQSSAVVVEYADMQKLSAAMSAADSSLPDMLTVTDADDNAAINFSSVSDMDYNKVAHYFLTYSSEGKADEICVIALKDQTDVLAAKSALELHKTTRVRMYREYDAAQAPRAESGLVFTDGLYAVLIISDNAEAVKAAFTAEIAGD